MGGISTAVIFAYFATSVASISAVDKDNPVPPTNVDFIRAFNSIGLGITIMVILLYITDWKFGGDFLSTNKWYNIVGFVANTFFLVYFSVSLDSLRKLDKNEKPSSGTVGFLKTSTGIGLAVSSLVLLYVLFQLLKEANFKFKWNVRLLR